MNRIPLITSITVAVLIISISTYALIQKQTGPLATATPLVKQSTLDTLPVKDESTADTTHLAPSIIPPTNSWLSGMVLQKTPLAVYPMPLSFLAKEDGFELGLPTITSTQTTITGGHTPGVAATIDGAASFQMTRFDKVSATLTYHNASKDKIANVTLSEGSPYVFYRSLTDSTLTIDDIVPSRTGDGTSQYLRYTKNDHDYVIKVGADDTIMTSGSTATVKLAKNSLATLYALPDKNKDELQQYADNELQSVETSYDVTDQMATTSLRYRTVNDKPTVSAAMGYQKTVGAGQQIAPYQTIYGSMNAVTGNELTTTVPRVPSSNKLDISMLTDEQKARLVTTLRADVANTKITAEDSYFAGKQLARAANLLDLARQLRQQDLADQLSSLLNQELAKRLDGEYFYYDGKLKGIAATTKAFGSEDFNDHHFHYGYFIYAASVLGRHDTQFLDKYKDHVNLLVADIASYEPSDKFPVQRNYDAYAAHSWAAGLAPFADGNNQESSSEAMNAWNAVAEWGLLTKNTKLTQTGQWMLANESESGRLAWRTPPSDVPNITAFTSPLTSLNFGGKRTYSTFFSDEPNAKLGIQLLTMNPFMIHLPDDKKTVEMLVANSTTDDNFNVALGDYVVMYLSLKDPQRALALSEKQQDKFIDDGNSRTYMNAFIYSKTDK
ncbi:MAG: glycosyl hydrolase [Candidatus Saccharimonadales bacterium]